jgi:hypothetical protein
MNIDIVSKISNNGKIKALANNGAHHGCLVVLVAVIDEVDEGRRCPMHMPLRCGRRGWCGKAVLVREKAVLEREEAAEGTVSSLGQVRRPRIER